MFQPVGRSPWSLRWPLSPSSGRGTSGDCPRRPPPSTQGIPAPPGRAGLVSSPSAPPPSPPPAGRSAPFGLLAPGDGQQTAAVRLPALPRLRGAPLAVTAPPLRSFRLRPPVSGSASLLGSPAPSRVQSTRAATSARGRAVGVRSYGGKLPPPPSLPPTARPCPLLGPARPVVDLGLSVGPSRRLRAVGRRETAPAAHRPAPTVSAISWGNDLSPHKPSSPPQPRDRVPRLNPLSPTLALTGVRSPDRICRRRYTGTTPPDSPPAPTTG